MSAALLVLDNYDSFTYNLVQYLGELGAKLEVVRNDRITVDVFYQIVPDGQKADLLDGVIYVASPDNTDASELTTWLGTIISTFVERKELGKVYFLKVAYRIGPKRGPEPDIGFVSKERIDAIQRGRVLGGPDLAVEVERLAQAV